MVLLGLLGAAGLLVAPDPANGCAPVTLDAPPVNPVTPRPTAPGTGCATTAPSDRDAFQRDTRLPRVARDPDQPAMAARTATLTGSAVTMTGLRIEGITELPTTDGNVKVVKLSMNRADLHDVLLRSSDAGRTMRFTTDRLALRGDIALYVSRFVGLRAGATITFGPDLPLPDGIPVVTPGPVTLTEPAIDLVFLHAGTVTARPRLTLSLTRD